MKWKVSPYFEICPGKIAYQYFPKMMDICDFNILLITDSNGQNMNKFCHICDNIWLIYIGFNY
ncbi:hypothetical protein LPB140_04980 [Sphingorhabdus lutea]|uniref:Uncharacterized protein n=1 Tax=Sphingorhabdus lutea TaxID=1913578 RepID=A0A1L3JB26_9SPHN|nr:hypothetical protein LPB140_04980 [Sphingorhabdus lutea]